MIPEVFQRRTPVSKNRERERVLCIKECMSRGEGRGFFFVLFFCLMQMNIGAERKKKTSYLPDRGVRQREARSSSTANAAPQGSLPERLSDGGHRQARPARQACRRPVGVSP